MQEALKNRNRKIFRIFLNYFFAPLLFLWLSWSIYRQITHQPNLHSSWISIKTSLQSFDGACLFFSVLLLMIVNWSIEAVKWKLSVRSVQPISFSRSLKAIMTGVSFSITTPNRIGEYFGRMLYMAEGNRLRVIALTIVGSISQLIITLFFGLIGLVVLHSQLDDLQSQYILNVGDDVIRSRMPSLLWMQVLEFGVAAVLIILTLFYFRLAPLTRLIMRWKRSERWAYLVNALENLDATLLFKILSLSAARYIVFIIQYFLLLRLFDVDISWWNALWTVSTIFLVLAIVPSLAIAELGQRQWVSWEFLKLYSSNYLGIAFTAVTIWAINLVIPAVIGSLLILRIKILKNKDENNRNSSD
jgi:hypothetical protein